MFSAFEDLVTNDLNAQKNAVVGNDIAYGRQPAGGGQGGDVGNPFGLSPPRPSNNSMEQQQNQQHLSNPFGDAPTNSMPGMVNAYGQQQQPNGNMQGFNQAMMSRK